MSWKTGLLAGLVVSASVVSGWYLGSIFGIPNFLVAPSFFSPVIDKTQPLKKLPLNQYRIAELQERSYQPSNIILEQVLETQPTYTSYLFTYRSLDKQISGQLNVPTQDQPAAAGYPVIIMLRGWVPAESYRTGVGTSAAAEVLASHGYLTIAPDFLGYGQSDTEDDDPWVARFQKPINILELITTLKHQSSLKYQTETIPLDDEQLGIWAHSNGGQIALTTLEVLHQTIPTTLWAPVTAPFPYSVLFYSDEHSDEGQEARRWVSLFEDDYNALEFSLTQHLDQLTGPLQIHQGTGDEAVPFAWNDEFVDKLETENQRRATLSSQLAADPTNPDSINHSDQLLSPIEINYFTYAGADHNLKPNWNQAINRDLDFFAQYL